MKFIKKNALILILVALSLIPSWSSCSQDQKSTKLTKACKSIQPSAESLNRTAYIGICGGIPFIYFIGAGAGILAYGLHSTVGKQIATTRNLQNATANTLLRNLQNATANTLFSQMILVRPSFKDIMMKIFVPLATTSGAYGAIAGAMLFQVSKDKQKKTKTFESFKEATSKIVEAAFDLGNHINNRLTEATVDDGIAAVTVGTILPSSISFLIKGPEMAYTDFKNSFTGIVLTCITAKVINECYNSYSKKKPVLKEKSATLSPLHNTAQPNATIHPVVAAGKDV